IVLTTPVDTSIGFVKILMQDSEGIAFERQRIFLNKKELQDADTIYSIGLRDGNLLQLLNADHPLPRLVINITVIMLTGKRIPLRVPYSIPVITLKDLIRKGDGIPPDQQRLICGGTHLEDDRRPLADYNIRTDSTIYMVLQLKGG
ncbi:ubiquitin-related domain-containing protein, partial [Mucidula mucida]